MRTSHYEIIRFSNIKKKLLIGSGLVALTASLAPNPAYAANGDEELQEEALWAPHGELVARGGSSETSGTVEIFVPLAQDDDSLLFFDGRFGVSSEADYLGNWGLGLRQIVGPDVLVGGYGYFDATRTENNQEFYAATVGTEILTSDFDLRANLHIPITKERFVRSSISNSSTVGIVDNQIVESFTTQRFDEASLTGVDVEAGVRFFSSADDSEEFRIFGAVYHYWSDRADNFTGGRARAEYRVNDAFGMVGSQLNVGAEIRHDRDRGTEGSAEVRLRIPFGGNRASSRRSSLSSIQRRANERVRRELPVRTSFRTTNGVVNQAAIDDQTGAVFGSVLFVDGANSVGAGSLVDPTTLGDAAARARAGDIIVGEGNSGTITTGGVTLSDGANLVGGGTAVQVRLANGQVQAFALGQQAGTVNNTTATNTITLGNNNLIQNLTFTGGATAIAGMGITGNVIDNVTISGPANTGITLASAGSNVITNSNVSGGAGGGLVVTSGAGNAVLALNGNSFGAIGGNVVDLNGTGGSLTVTNLTNTTINGGNGETGGLIAENVSFDADPAMTGVQTVAGGNLAVGSATARVGGPGVSLNNVAGGVAFDDVDIFTNGGTGLFIRDAGGKAGSFAFANTSGTIDAIGGAATDIDPVTMNSVFDSLTSANSATFGVNLDTVTGSFVVTGDTSVSNAGTVGINIVNSGGTIRFGGNVVIDGTTNEGVKINGGTVNTSFTGNVDITGAGGSGVDIGETGGNTSFNAGLAVSNVASTGLTIANSSGNVTINSAGGTTAGDGVRINTTGGAGLSLNNNSGTVTINGVSTTGTANEGVSITSGSNMVNLGQVNIVNAGTNGLTIGNQSGGVTAGTVVIIGAAGDGILISGTNGDLVFGDTDITSLTGGTGVDVSGANGNITFATLDITGNGTAGSKGIDLFGSTNSGNVVTTDSGTIMGVDVGVDLTGANITGNFQYGDGANTDADGAASTIMANTPIVFTGLGATGDYNFLDVNVIGDTSALTIGVPDLFFIDTTAGTGTANDPGSITQAEASGADIFVLVNDGSNGGLGTIDSAGSSGDETFLLTADQQVFSFLNQTSFDILNGGPPVNLRVNGFAAGGTVTIDDPTGNGAAVLISSAGDALTLGGNNVVNNSLIGDSTGFGITIRGLTDPSIITNSRISSVGVTGGSGDVGIANSNLTSIAIRGGSANVTLANSVISQDGADTIVQVNDGHTGEFTLDASSSISTSSGGGILFDDASGNYTLIGDIALANDGGLAILNSAGVFGIGNIAVANSTGSGINLDGANGAISFASIDIDNAAVNGFAISGATNDITVNGGSINDGGATTLSGLLVTNQATTSTIRFNGVDLAHDQSANGAISVSNSTGALTFDATTTVNASSGSNFQFNMANGTYDFGGTFNLSGGAGIDISASGGAFTFDDQVSITNSLTNAINVTSSAATIRFNDVLAINNSGSVANGVSISSNSGTITFGGGLDITTGAGAGLSAVNSGTLTIDGAVNTIDTTTGQAINLENVTIGAAGAQFVTISTDVVAGATALNFDQVSGGSFSADTVTVDGTTGSASEGISIIGSGADFSFGNVTIANVDNHSVSLNGANGDVTFGSLDITNSGNRGFEILDATSDVTVNGGSIDDGAVLTGFGVTIQNQGAASTIAFTDFDITHDGGGADAFNAQNTAGTITATGGTFINMNGNDVVDINGGDATIVIDAALIDSGQNQGIEIDGITGGSITFGGDYTSTGTGNAIEIGGAVPLTDGSILFNGNVAVSGGANIEISNLGAATVNFANPLTIDGPTGNGIDITGTNGTIGFGDVTISNLGAGTGIDLTGADGNVTFTSINITGTGAAGSTGINLSGSTNSGNITTTNPSSITGVDTGVDISNANITGMFQFGDGSDVDTNGRASTIFATTPIDATGLGATGAFNFLDVDFGANANPGGATGVFDVPVVFYFANTVQGTGDGSNAANAGTVLGAEQSNADVLVPVGAIAAVIDVSAGEATDALDLDNDQQLRGFAVGEDTIDVGVSGPANVLLSAMTSQAMNINADGSPALTQSVGGAVIALADGNILGDITINNMGGNADLGILGDGINSLVANNVTIDGTVAGIDIANSTGMFVLDTIAVNTTSGTGINLSTNPSTIFTFSGLDVNTGSGIGFSTTGGGILNITGAGNSIISQTGRILDFANIAIGTGGVRFDTLMTGVTPGDALRISAVSGGLFSANSVDIGGTVADDGLSIADSSATFDFGNVTIADVDNHSVSLNGANGDVTFGSLDITNSGNRGFEILDAISDVTINGGSIDDGAVLTGFGVTIQNQGAASTIAFTDFDITHDGGGADAFNLVDAAGTITVTGGTFVNMNGNDVVDINGGDATIVIDAALIDSGQNQGIEIDGITGGSITFGGDYTSTGTGNAIQIGGAAPLTGGSIAFNGDITAIGGASNIVISNLGAAVSVDFAGAVNATGATGTGINIGGNAGTIGFAGLTTVTNAGGTSVNLTNNMGADISFTGGLVIDGSTGLRASGGGMPTITGAGNTIDVIGTAGAIDLDGIAVGAGGITFDSVTTAATATANGIDINDVTGGTITVTNVNLDGGAGTAGLNVSGNARTSDVIIGSGMIANGITISDGGTGAVIIDANVAENDGYAVQVADRTMGSGLVTINGTVTSNTGVVSIQNNSGGMAVFTNTVTGTGANTAGAINIDNNTGGITSFNGSVDLDLTGNGAGVDLTNNTGATVNFTGGLTIDSVDGTALNANGGGILNITGAGNSIISQTGRILDFANIAIGTGGVRFDTLMTGVTPGDALRISAVSGGLFSASSVNIGGTGADDGLSITDSSATFDFGNVTIANVDNHSVSLNGANGDVTFGSLDITNSGNRGFEILDATNDVTVNGGSIDDGSALTGFGVTIQNQGAASTIAFTDFDITHDGGGADAFNAQNTAGTITVTGGTFINTNANDVVDINGGDATIVIDAALIDSGQNQGIEIDGITGGSITFGGDYTSTGTDNAIQIGGAAPLTGGSIAFNGNVAVSGGANIEISNLGATTVTFNDAVTITDPAANAIDISGTIGGAISFADLNIALQSDNSTGIELNGAILNANVTVADFDLTSTTTTNTIGIDLRGATGTGTIQFGDSNVAGADATITAASGIATDAGVATGVIFNDAANLNFIFGDGEGVTDTGSVIAATTAIDFTNDTGATGTYNFLDVTFPVVGSISNLGSNPNILNTDQ